MKKKCDRILSLVCYALGIFAAIYIGAYLMLLQPVQSLWTAFYQGGLTLSLVFASVVKIGLSTTCAGFVWCLGYIGYNYFKGTEDPDWETMEREAKS